MSDAAKPAAAPAAAAAEAKKEATPAPAPKKEAAPAANGAASTGAAAAAAAASPAAGGETPKSAGGGKFKENFRAFSKFGDTKSDGKLITLSQSDKWMKQAGVIDKAKITTTDTGIHFKKFKALKINVQDYEKFIGELAKARKMEVSEIKDKMSECGAPGHTGSSASGNKVPSAVDRLTDVSRYTGSHKQRFDETGKGRGIAGRKDVPESSGYVHGYQNKDSYSKMH